jgi:hypothetical protein
MENNQIPDFQSQRTYGSSFSTIFRTLGSWFLRSKFGKTHCSNKALHLVLGSSTT